MKGWVILPLNNGDFAANMERVLDIYKRPYDKDCPVVCMDESPKQLIKETRGAIEMMPGYAAKEDFEYERCGVSHPASTYW